MKFFPLLVTILLLFGCERMSSAPESGEAYVFGDSSSVEFNKVRWIAENKSFYNQLDGFYIDGDSITHLALEGRDDIRMIKKLFEPDEGLHTVKRLSVHNINNIDIVDSLVEEYEMRLEHFSLSESKVASAPNSFCRTSFPAIISLLGSEVDTFPSCYKNATNIAIHIHTANPNIPQFRKFKAGFPHLKFFVNKRELVMGTK